MTQWNELMLQRLKKGDIKAQELLYREFSKPVYTAIFKICGNRDLANDLLHDSFLDAFFQIDKFRTQISIKAWLKRIAINNTVNFLKRSQLASKYIIDFRNDDDEYLEKDSTQLLDRLFSEISAEHRAVIWLFVVEQYKHHEIGEMLGQSESYSKSVVSRSLKRLQEQMKENN